MIRSILHTSLGVSAPIVTISPDNTGDTTFTITETGIYEFTLTADDGGKQTADTVQIVVGVDSCDASHMSTGDAYAPGDPRRKQGRHVAGPRERDAH